MLGNLEWKLFDSGKCQGKFVTDCWTDWWTHEYDFIFHSNILIFVITVSQAEVNGKMSLILVMFFCSQTTKSRPIESRGNLLIALKIA